MKIITIKNLLILLVVFLISGCYPDPEILKHYKSCSYNNSDCSETTVRTAYSIFSRDVPATSTTTNITQLSDEGQAALIQAFNTRASSNSELISLLAEGIKKPSQPTSDKTIFKKRIVASVVGGSLSPAERLDFVDINVSIDSRDGTFTSWDKFSTQYAEIDLGSDKFTQLRSFSPELKLGTDDAQVLPFSTQNTREESVTYRSRTVELTSILTPYSATLIQKGVANRDLTGNVIFDLDIDLKDCGANGDRQYLFTNMFKDGKPNEAKDIGVRALDIIIPENADRAVSSRSTANLLVRAIVSGEDTITESDDEIDYLSIPKQDNFYLIERKQNQHYRYLISTLLHVSKKGVTTRGPLELNIKNGLSSGTLQVNSLQSARELLRWIITTDDPKKTEVIEGNTLSVPGLTWNEIDWKHFDVKIERLKCMNGKAVKI